MQGAFRLEIHEALPSTSTHLAARAASGEAEGLAVMARRQTAGRGRDGRAWESPPGNLHLSLLLRPQAPLHEAPRYGLLAAVALADALAPHLPEPAALALKWPNDVLLRGAKCSGILAEVGAGDRGGIAWLILGIGVNLAHAPAMPDRPTASLAALGVTPPSPEAFAEELLAAIARWRDVHATEGFAAIRTAWLARGPALDSAITVRSPRGVLAGHFAGLAEDGGLLLAAEGRIRPVTAGEVAF